MVNPIELQIISRLLTSDSVEEVNTLLGFDDSYFSVFKPYIQYIHEHHAKYNQVPDVFTFQARFTQPGMDSVQLVKVTEPLQYLIRELNQNKQGILMVETFNKLKDLGTGDVTAAWEYLSHQCELVSRLSVTQPMDLIKDAQSRAQQLIEFRQQARIPTGFAEIDRLMYGGLSTVEELLVIIARTNTGKSWVGTKMMESAQQNGFPVLYYSPEMQGAYLGTRFDTWRGKFANSQLYQGNYTEQYQQYILDLQSQQTSAFILEDKDTNSGAVNVAEIRRLVHRHKIKLVIIDGLSYVEDTLRGGPDHIKYKNICNDLFRLSKQYSCAVVVMMQANRDSKDNKDEKGLVFPDIYNAEGSDHPGRIATQVFSMRQIHEKSVLDIRLEKSRTANNEKPVASYAWDINTGNMQYLPAAEDDLTSQTITPISISQTGLELPRGPAVPPKRDEIDEFDLSDDNIEF